MSTAFLAEQEHFDQRRPSARGEPAWDLALLYPPQFAIRVSELFAAAGDV